MSLTFAKVFRSSGKFLDAIGQMLELNPYIETLQPSTRSVKLGSKSPSIESAFVAPTATVIGGVNLGNNSSVWYGAVIRGDVQPIKVGSETVVGDRVMLHVSGGPPGYPLVIGSRVLIKAGAIVHGCTVHDGAVIGEGAQVMDGAIVESNAQVAAGAIVPKGKVIKSGQLWAGVPAKYQRDLTSAEIENFKATVDRYVELASLHASEADKPWNEIDDDVLKYAPGADPLNFDIDRQLEIYSKELHEHEYHQVPGRLFDSNLLKKPQANQDF